MYLTVTSLFTGASIFFILGSLSGFAVYLFILRRYVMSKSFQSHEYELRLEEKRKLILQHEADLKIKTNAIQQMIYDAHHKSLNPLYKSMRGLINLLRMVTPDGRAITYLNELEALILKAEEEWLKRFRKFEHLQ